MPTEHVSGICRFYLQEVSPKFRLYVTPINVDPAAPAVRISEPAAFIKDISEQLGLFYTTGFQEDHKALSTACLRTMSTSARRQWSWKSGLRMLEYAVENYDDGLLFFYFSSSDLQSHMFWWDSDDATSDALRTPGEEVLRPIQAIVSASGRGYRRHPDRYGKKATIFVMSDHGFANFGRQFNLNSWLRDCGYLHPRECSSILQECRLVAHRRLTDWESMACI